MAEKKIQLILRDAGIGSRRKVEELIRERRVTLNGQIVEHPGLVADPDRDHIKLDGKLLHFEDTVNYYYLFNKPRNVVSTMDDPQGRPCVGDLVRKMRRNLFSVGRLDFDAEGLMVLTNDGALAQTLSHPSAEVPRTYLVKIKGHPDEEALTAIHEGMDLGEGDRLGKIRVTIVGRREGSTWVRVVIFEGKKNEIKRIFLRIQHPVRTIRRIGFGPLRLGDLPVGRWRSLTDEEIEKTLALAAAKEKRGPKPPRPAGPRPSPASSPSRRGGRIRNVDK
jgi:23S rRNA pseudouridine2605 synthase